MMNRRAFLKSGAVGGAVILALILWWGLAPAAWFDLMARLAAALPLLS